MKTPGKAASISLQLRIHSLMNAGDHSSVKLALERNALMGR